MIKKYYYANKQTADKVLFLAAIFLFIYLFVKVVYFYIAPFVYAYLISLALSPIVSLLNKRLKIPRGIGTALMIVISLFLIIFFGNLIFSKLGSEITSFLNNRDVYVSKVIETANTIKDKYYDLVKLLPTNFSDFAEKALINISAETASVLASGAKTGLFNFVSAVPVAILSGFIFILSTFFFTKDKPAINAHIKKYTPRWLISDYTMIKAGLINTLWGFIKSALIIMVIVTAICVTGLSILGFPYAFLIGIAAGVIDALPAFGVGFFLYPMFFFYLATGSYSAAIGIACIYIAVHVTRQMLEPKILGSQIGLHPLLTLMSIYVGLKIFGIIGFAIGPTFLVICKIILSKNLEGTFEKN